MNPIDIDAMPPGPELDALAARAMGWRNIHAPEGGNIYLGEQPDDYNRDCWDGVINTLYKPHVKWVPKYSADIAAAWTLEKPGKWYWSFTELVKELNAYVLWQGNKKVEQAGATVAWCAVQDKAAAYALARTRAFVKAWLAQTAGEKV